MKKWIGVGLLLILMLSGCGEEPEAIKPEEKQPATLEEMKATAMTYVQDLLQGNYEAAYAEYTHDEAMKKAVKAEIYKQIMEDLYKQVGQPVAVLKTAEWEAQGFQIVQVAVAFSEKDFGMNVVFNEFGEIAGLNYSEVAVMPEEAEASDESEAVVVEPIAVGPYELEGELMLPEGASAKSPAQVVILVHGSGASDKDETVGPNKPFLDLAQGLADQGIATIRYDKRAFTHAESFMEDYEFTVWEETVEDALAAVELAKADERLNNYQIYILGHSLGGYLIPRMMENTQEVAGWIFMAANNQPLKDMVVEQYTYLAGLDGETTEEERAAIEQVKAISEALRDPSSLDEEVPIMGAYPAYWIDLHEYRPVELVQEFTVPKLFLQGERDYQVPVEQFETWKETIGAANAEFVLFNQLNHLMMPGEGAPNPGEYQLPNHVDQRVIDTIAEFIDRQW